MFELYNKETQEFLGRISDDQMKFLSDNLVEENLTDDDYYLNRTVFDALKDKGMPEELVQLAESAMGDSDEVEIRFQKMED